MTNNREKLTLTPGYRGYLPVALPIFCYSVLLYGTFHIGLEKLLYVLSIGLEWYEGLGLIHLFWKALLAVAITSILAYLLWNELQWFIQSRKTLELTPEGFSCGDEFAFRWSDVYGFYLGSQKGPFFAGDITGVFFELKSNIIPKSAYNFDLKPIQVSQKVNLRQINIENSFQKMLPAFSYQRFSIEQALSAPELVQLLNVWKQRYASESKQAFSTATAAAPAPWAVVLGVSERATAQEIRQAYRSKLKVRHPDHGGSAEAFIQLQMAYNQAMSNQHYINTLAQ